MLSSFNVLRPLPLLLSPTLARCPWDIVWDSWSVCLLFVTLSVCQQCPSDPPPPCVGLPTFVGLPHYKSLGGQLDPLLPNVHIAIGSLPHMQDQLCMSRSQVCRWECGSRHRIPNTRTATAPGLPGHLALGTNRWVTSGESKKHET